MELKKGDRVKVNCGPLSGMVVELVRHHLVGKGWTSKLEDGRVVMVWDYEFPETVERKGRRGGK